jgi:D-ribose pyranose/furanose isomerase RbsD
MVELKENTMSYITRSIPVTVLMLTVISLCGCTNNTWQSHFNSVLSEYGHRNWIVIADSAYPKQSASGIETIATGTGHLEVLDVVLEAVADARHVQAIVMLDAELDSVTESDAPGVTEYRSKLKASLKGRQVKVMPHEEIIRALDQASEMFNILLLKTNMTIPYTSVFLQLDCGYWNAEKEKRLRNAITRKK